MDCLEKGCKQAALPGEAYCYGHRYGRETGPGYEGGAMLSDPPIIITGGSVTIQFDDNVLRPDGAGKLSAQDKKIRRVEIKGGGIDFAQDTPNGKVKITIHYGDP